MRTSDGVVTVNLTEAERSLLGIRTWQRSDGPRVTNSSPLIILDWARALTATEIVFIS